MVTIITIVYLLLINMKQWARVLLTHQVETSSAKVLK